jgi:hypothetical protein
MSYRAGSGATRSRAHACGDATVEPIVSASLPIRCAPAGSDPLQGPSPALRRAPQRGDATKANATACRLWNICIPTRAVEARA